MAYSRGFPSERLTSDLGPDGRWHARYPTAERTLCGIETPGATPGPGLPPDCGPCAKTARRFHEIDKSMPDHWLISGGRCTAQTRSGTPCGRVPKPGTDRCPSHPHSQREAA